MKTLRPLRQLLIALTLTALLAACSSLNPQTANTSPMSHQLWDSLLKQHVNDEGWVDYEGFMADSASLRKYLTLLQSNGPNDANWSRNEQLAYWINLYNAFTVELILQHYPLKSIKDIGSSIQVPFINSPWDIKFIEVGGETLDLNNVEHNILRKHLQEPRIHFAINCASYSCPRLRNEAFTADRLEAQLEAAAVEFINDPKRNTIAKDKVAVSQIFNWFKGDFTKEGSLVDYLNQYSQVPIDPKAKVSHRKYDWKLNSLGN